MQFLRKGIRGIARLFILAFLILILSQKIGQQKEVISFYMNSYDHMIMIVSIEDYVYLPLSQDIPQFFRMFYYADIAYESIAILLILFGKSKGGIMIALWQVIYILFCYSPNVFRVVRKPFTFRHLFKFMRDLAVLGVFIALAHQKHAKKSIQQQKQKTE